MSASFVYVMYNTSLSRGGILDWWLALRDGHNRLKQKGVDSMVMLIVWCLWKERNARVFDNAPGRSVSDMVQHVLMEGQLWINAGAKWLGALGWPMASPATAAAPVR